MVTSDKREAMRQRILETCDEIMTQSGVGGLTFDAIARRLGVSKQAVLYWFPTKQDLLRVLVLPWIQDEAAAVIEAVRDSGNAREAVAATVRALVDFHQTDLDRFRQIYMGAQLDPKPYELMPQAHLLDEIHPVTSEMYGALEHALTADATFHPALPPRQAAMMVHSATLGLLMMVGLARAIDDPLAHGTDGLVATLTTLLQEGAVPA